VSVHQRVPELEERSVPLSLVQFALLIRNCLPNELLLR
jgi:hypothetical protein